MDKTLLTRVKAALEEYGPAIERAVEVPTSAPVQADPREKSYLTRADRALLTAGLKKLPTPVLWGMLNDAMDDIDRGIPFGAWAAAGGRPMGDALQQDRNLRKTLDTVGATALIRQDLEPILYEIYVREFPAWDDFAKEPSNGLVHAYNKQTSFGDAQFMTELGTVTDDVGVYSRATTPIAVIATRRGITLKSQFATLQGGAGFNPEQLELRNGLRAIAHKMQKTIFQGNATASGGLTSNEDGPYDVNSFDGLRRTIQTNAYDINPLAATPDSIRTGIGEITRDVMNAGGRTTKLYVNPDVKHLWDISQDANVRYMATGGVNVGMLVNGVNTPFGDLPLNVIPGDSIGSYTHSGHTFSDIYALDMETLSIPYLGSEGVTVLDIPTGIGGQLTHQFVMFGMWGFAIKVETFNGKVRVETVA
jgi:hypothetical protein